MALEKGKIKLNLCTAAALAAACEKNRKVASPRSTKRLRTPTQLVHTYPIRGLFIFFNSADCGNIIFDINYKHQTYPISANLPNQRPVYFFTTVPAMEYTLDI